MTTATITPEGPRLYHSLWKQPTGVEVGGVIFIWGWRETAVVDVMTLMITIDYDDDITEGPILVTSDRGGATATVSKKKNYHG